MWLRILLNRGEKMPELTSFFRGLLPTTTQIEIGAAVAAFGTAASYMLGWDKALEALLFAMAIDYISGLLAAYILSLIHI